MASTKLRTPPLPVEITENIIQLYLGGPYTFPRSHRPSDLAPLLLVCKGWHEYGERQLYRSIFISDDREHSGGAVALLCATLSQNSRLANLVRFFTFESSRFDVRTVFAITEIISLSSNLTHLSISRLGNRWQRINWRVLESLKHALAERSLKYFRLYSANGYFKWTRTDTLCSRKETLALLANWPDLEEFSFIDYSTHRNPFEIPPETPARCLALRRVQVQGFDIACVLAKIAPFVEDVDIHENREIIMSMDVLVCLHTWSETLIRLKLHFAVELRDKMPYFPPLRKLRYFCCEGPDVHPRCLESMDSLEELFYCVRAKHAKQIVNCFRLGTGSGDFLPALKVLRFRPYFFLDESLRAVLKSLEEICTRRSISFSAYDDEGYYWLN